MEYINMILYGEFQHVGRHGDFHSPLQHDVLYNMDSFYFIHSTWFSWSFFLEFDSSTFCWTTRVRWTVEMSTWVDNSRDVLFCRRFRDSTGESNKENDTRKTTWLSTMLSCCPWQEGQQVRHSASTMMRQHWVVNRPTAQPLCQSNPTWSCTSTSTWWMATSAQHVVTFVWQWRNTNSSRKPRFQTFSWQPQGARQVVSTDWQCHHQG